MSLASSSTSWESQDWSLVLHPLLLLLLGIVGKHNVEKENEQICSLLKVLISGEHRIGMVQIRNCELADPGFIVQPLDRRHFSALSLTLCVFLLLYYLVPIVFPRAVTVCEDKINRASPTLSASHSPDWDLPSTEHSECPQELQQDEVVSDFHVPILQTYPASLIAALWTWPCGLCICNSFSSYFVQQCPFVDLIQHSVYSNRRRFIQNKGCQQSIQKVNQNASERFFRMS